MRKIHSAALAEVLRREMLGLAPGFHPVSANEARVLGTQRRMSFLGRYPHGTGYLLFQPSGTATDNYFTLDVVWATPGAEVTEWLNPVIFLPDGSSPLDLARNPPVRLRGTSLWCDAPEGDVDAFEFSTASSRFNEIPFSDEAFQRMLEEEGRMSPEDALNEISPALERCLSLVRAYVLPFFTSASDAAA